MNILYLLSDKELLRLIKVFKMDSKEFYRKNGQEYADDFIAKSSMKCMLLSIFSGEQKLHKEITTKDVFAD